MASNQCISSPARIGLFGGTFDPVHFGHLRPAIELAEHFELDVLYLLPNFRPAHRGPTGATSTERIAMLHEAVAEVQRLEVDTREAERARPTFTVETLEELRAEHPEASLMFFLGMDAFARFDRWERWQEILELAHLVVIDRPGASLSSSAEQILEQQQRRVGSRIMRPGRGGAGHEDGRVGEAAPANGPRVGVIERVSVTQLDISATDIRARVAAGRTLRFLLPDSTREYIEREGLYGASVGASRESMNTGG